MEKNNRIVIVSGPQKGMGKTVISSNLAVDLAMRSRKQVVVLDLDPFCKGEVAHMLDVSSPSYISEMSVVMQREILDGELLRGRIGFNKWGVGVLSLAPHEKVAVELPISQTARVLINLSKLYPLIVDIEGDLSQMGILMFDLADLIFWILAPTNLFIRQTVDKLAMLSSYKFTFGKFCFILNQSNIEGAIKIKQINSSLDKFGKKIEESIPQDKLVFPSINKKIPLVIDEPRSSFAKGVRDMREIIFNIPQCGRKIERVSILEGLLNRLGEVVSQRAVQTGTAYPGENIASVTSPEEILKKAEEEKKRNQLKQKIHKQLISRLDVRKIDLISNAKNQQVRTIVEKTASFILSTEIDVDSMSRQEREKLIGEIVDEALGLGPIESLMAEPSITEIMVNKFNQIYIEREGKIHLTNKKFINNDQLIQVIRKIVAPLGRRIDESMPLVDARLKDGSRVNAIIPPLALQGPMLTIRRFPEDPLCGEDLVKVGSLTSEMLQFLAACVTIKKNMIVTGGTGTGKTTLLNVLSAAIPAGERIITIEDTAELKLEQEHVGRLESRPPNIEGKGEITIRDLVRNSLRMRPDRIVVGECRGPEALDMLQAMNTGHEGSLSTIHANSPRDMISRLETMILMAGMDLPVRAIREQIASAVHFIIHLCRFRDGTRKIAQITEITGKENDVITTQDIFVFRQTGITGGKVTGYHRATGNIPRCFHEFKGQGVDLSIEVFRTKKMERV